MYLVGDCQTYGIHDHCHALVPYLTSLRYTKLATCRDRELLAHNKSKNMVNLFDDAPSVGVTNKKEESDCIVHI